MKKILFFSIFTTFSLIFCQNYIWPTETGKELTSNFGEFRDSHFHMGLDIRTNSTIDHPLYAIQEGYISRIATNFNGYGKVLYLKTSDGKIAVYGHLNRYSEYFEELVRNLQNESGSYLINEFFSPEEHPVSRGEIIGYSGNSGGSTGPHLHFELRNKLDQPLNPLVFGFPLLDYIAPQFIDVSIIPLAIGTHIDRSPLPTNYYTIPSSPNLYILNDTLSVTGKFGITTRVIDKIQNALYTYQIEKLELLVDSISVFSINYNLLDFNEGENITTIYGQPVNHQKNDDFQKLYRLDTYPILTIHKDDKTGIINLTEGIHKLEINAWDAAQNKSVLTFYIRSFKPPHKAKHKTLVNLRDYPTFYSDLKVFIPQIMQLEKGTIFQLRTDIISSDTIMAFIKQSDMLTIFPLLKIDVDKYASEMIGPYFFKDSKSCGYLIFSNEIQKYKFDFTPRLILPDSTHKIFSHDSLGFIEINNATYDTTLMWFANQTPLLDINSSNHKSNVYEVFPYGIPFKNDISISLAINNDIDWKHCSIYSFNKKKSKWDFEKSSVDTLNNFITAKFSKNNIYSVLEDTRPPWFIDIYPKNQQAYSKDTLKQLIITLNDDLSDIDFSEEYLRVYLDDTRIWVAYQPLEKEISYILRNPLSIGEHSLLINIQDRSGNSASKSIKFFIE